MSSDTLDRRQTLAQEFIIQLIDVRDHLKKISCDLGDSSGGFLGKVYEDHYEKIQEKINLFNRNVEKVKNLNMNITTTFNDWYIFIKNDKELRSLLFPLRLYLKRKQLRMKTKELKQEITSIGIKNRLIREDIQHLESTLEYEATTRLKKDVRYDDYVSHLNTKSKLVEELKYILSTLSNINIRAIHMDRLEDTLEVITQAKLK